MFNNKKNKFFDEQNKLVWEELRKQESRLNSLEGDKVIKEFKI